VIYIVPSRGRPQNIITLIRAWEATRAFAELFVAVDIDDPTFSEYEKILKTAPTWVKWGKARRTQPGMVEALNRFATLHSRMNNGHDEIGFMGDDHAPRTWAWDTMIQDALKTQPGIVYGNDLIQGPNLPTAVAMSTSIVRALGRMAPMCLKHLYVDNYWKTLGEKLGRLTYMPTCIIEHMHPIAGKANWDDRYEAVNAGRVYDHDQRAYAKFIADGNMDRDVECVRRSL
jgi:hypothetical protein